MLPASARLRRRADFTTTVRRGRRGRSALLLVHLLRPTPDDGVSGNQPRTLATRQAVATSCGFVVSKAVGNSVTRHRVLRRLRHLMAPRLERLPAGSRLVVRALPAAGTASSAALGSALDRALGASLRSGHQPVPPT